ncbi:type II secretion system protein [Metapseudomonas lalkuanensis]|uniref:type II secretion system protein n=1 Tax=Metapseudomonas lalkuanensis TaxID=2604832 RepID=UPI001CF3AAE0|nr:type II secretion system protein [Pseudomonas lalkuanensis]UCO97544.1 type II secretion system protein [Pseudomonas lalkuanensis]
MRTGEQGFTYLGVLLLVMLMGMALAGAGQLWSTASQRARERDLLWVGSQYAQALRSYYRASNGVSQYPAALEDLLEDNRFPQAMRHLRRLYPDPVTGSLDWGLIHSFDGRIAGVYSQSRQRPLKQAHFPAQWVEFEGMGSYAEWRFVAEKAFMEGTPKGGTP